MPLGRILAITGFILFTSLAIAAYFKSCSPVKFQEQEEIPLVVVTSLSAPIEIELEEEVQKIPEIPLPPPPPPPLRIVREEKPLQETKELPDADRLEELFSVTGPKLPIVETITYKSRVPWLKGRPAWLSDYASHYETSRHFIARSLNGKADYFKQDISEGDKFNVLKQDRSLEFLLVVDITRCKMWVYALDGVSKEKILLKTFPVSLGRKDTTKESGLLTPLGKYSLGDRVAIYKPGVMGHYKGQKTEMIRIFGTRWIPFEKEVQGTTALSKGFGIHGVPWDKNKKGEWEQDVTSLGKYDSDGCIRLASDDMETLFAIIITHPAHIELVRDYFQSELSFTN